jgi:DNA-binding transcriptional LysR family regulator
MDVKDLKFFIAAYETGNFSRAAELLDTVPSNVSSRILALEEELGSGLLFERCWRGVAPTARGHTFYAYAKSLIADFERGKCMFKLPAVTATFLAQPKDADPAHAPVTLP